MIPRPPSSSSLAALLSSVVSQLSILLTLLLLHPFPPSSDSSAALPALLHHLLSSTTLAAAASRKRKPTSDPDESAAFIRPRLAELIRIDRRLATDPASFRAHFKMSPSTFEWLSDLLEPLLDCRDPIGSPLNLSPEFRLAIGLFRLSTGSDYPLISRLFRVPESVAIFCSNQLCRVLCTNFRFWLGFPNPSELQSSTLLPNCCGFIGCVRFRIKRTSAPDQIIASQIVVDSNSRLLNFVAGFHGDQTNLNILKSSTLYKDVETGRVMNSNSLEVNGVSVPQYLVGESGYPLLPWLMVPFSDPDLGSPERDFDSIIRSMRAPLVRAADSLRNWGVLRKPIEGELRNAVAYLGSCAILHNALLIREDFSAMCSEIDQRVDDDDDYGLGYSSEDAVVQESNGTEATAIRMALAKTVTQEVHLGGLS